MRAGQRWRRIRTPAWYRRAQAKYLREWRARQAARRRRLWWLLAVVVALAAVVAIGAAGA